MPEFEKEILGLLRKIDEKLDKLLGISSLEGESAKTAIPPEDEYVKPSVVVEKQEEAEKAEIKPPVEGRRVCPKCGGITFNKEEDKSQVLFQQGGMKIYKTRHICKNCGAEV